MQAAGDMSHGHRVQAPQQAPYTYEGPGPLEQASEVYSIPFFLARTLEGASALVPRQK